MKLRFEEQEQRCKLATERAEEVEAFNNDLLEEQAGNQFLTKIRFRWKTRELKGILTPHSYDPITLWCG